MSINQLGRLNFAGLQNYRIQPSDMDLFEQYIESYVKELIAQGRSAGLIYGGAIVPASGLTVTVQKSLWLTAAGQLVTVDDTNVTLAAADPANPRLDRIEFAYSLDNNTAVLDINGNNETLDKKHDGTYPINKGTAAATPVANATTAGNLSAGIVTVAANQTVLVQANIDQSEVSTDHGRNIANRSFSATIANNQSSAASLIGMAFSSLKTKAARIECEIYRYDGVTERVTQASLRASYYPVANTWKLETEFNGDDPGVTFTITAAGQIQYASDNMAGGGAYTGSVNYQIKYLN